MGRTINIEGIPLTAGSRVELANRHGEHVAVATVIRVAQLGALGTGTLIIDPYSGDVMTVDRNGYGVVLRLLPDEGLCADPEQWVPVLQLDESAPVVDAAA